MATGTGESRRTIGGRCSLRELMESKCVRGQDYCGGLEGQIMSQEKSQEEDCSFMKF